MNIDKSFDADELMIQGVTLFGKARSLKGISKIQALKELSVGAKLMNRSIKLVPESVPNRLTRLRHMLGATMRSPRKFHKQLKSDIEFLDNVITELSLDEKTNFISAKGEYYYYLGDKKLGKALIKSASELSPDSFIGQYSKILYEKLLKEKG